MTSTDMIFNSTVTGYSHIIAEKKCQDFSCTWQNSTGSMCIATVSDGHGGDAYRFSDVGARLACQCALIVLRQVGRTVDLLPESPSSAEIVVQNAVRAIVARWNHEIHERYNNASVKEFGCTLIAYLQTRHYWVALQIGDGKFAILSSEEEWSQPVPWDDRCILNFTTSMCDDNAAEEFRFAFGRTLPKGVFLSSDGIDSTFEDGDLLYNFYGHVMRSALEEDYADFSDALPGFLSHFSEVGSGDDMSLAVIINN